MQLLTLHISAPDTAPATKPPEYRLELKALNLRVRLLALVGTGWSLWKGLIYLPICLHYI